MKIRGLGGRWRSLGLLIFAALFFLILTEVGLWLTSPWHSQMLANALRTRQGGFPGGMHVRLSGSDLRFQRPDLSVDNYWNGYTWQHSTDERGFRNPPQTATRVLLLGDSLIYGHGVEEDETLAAVLRREHRFGAYSMARQGDGLYQSYVLYRLFASELAPRRVILFPFVNDIWDIHLKRSQEQIEKVPEIVRSEAEYEDLRRRLGELGEPSRFGRLAFRFGSVRLAYGLGRKIQRSRTPAAARQARFASGVDPSEAPFVRAIFDDQAFDSAMAYYRHVLTDLAERCREDGVRFEIVYLDLPWGGEAGDRAQQLFAARLRTLTEELEIPFATTRGLFDACPTCVLPGDGHLSPEGHDVLAGFVAGLP